MSSRDEMREQDMPAQPLSKPNPDPSIYTNDAIERAINAERDYVDGQIAVVLQRLDGIDTATQLLQVTADKVPDHIAKVVLHLRELVDEKFSGVKTQFAERDIRAEREARDNKVAVDAAFAAQKEAASEQNKSNTLAITKSEIATTETINKLAELFKTTTDALRDKIDDVKANVNGMASVKQGGQDVRTDQRAAIGSVGTMVGIAAAIFSVFALYLSSRTDAPVLPVAVNNEIQQTQARIDDLETLTQSNRLRIESLEAADVFLCKTKEPTLPPCP